jgi:hypothetical protein
MISPAIRTFILSPQSPMKPDAQIKYISEVTVYSIAEYVKKFFA